MGDDPDEPRKRVSDARGAAKQHNTSGGRGRRIPRGAGGANTGPRTPAMGSDPDQPRYRAPDARSAGDRDGPTRGGACSVARRAGRADARAHATSMGEGPKQFGNGAYVAR